MPASATPRGTLAKNETISSSSATTGTIICPLRPCTMNPTSSGNADTSLSITDLSSTPPSWIHFPRPKTA